LLLNDGLDLTILPNSKIEEPVYIINIIDDIDENTFINSRKNIQINNDSSVNIIELNFIYSDFDVLFSDISLMVVMENSQVNQTCIDIEFKQKSSKRKIAYFRENGILLDRDSNLNLNTISHSNFYNSHKYYTYLQNSNNSINQSFFVLGSKDAITDMKSSVNHNLNNSNSKQNYFAIADGNSTINFESSVVIEDNTTKTNAKQNCKGILLSDDVNIHFVPTLVISNDDVAASHGASIGAINEEDIFYLNSRGIDKEEATKILLATYYNHIIENSHIPEQLIQKIKQNIISELF
jgi:Fe-S cluster assembly protein SufD